MKNRCHKDAVLKTVTIPVSCRDIGETLSSQLAKEKLERRQCFLKLMSSMRFLARQALQFMEMGMNLTLIT